MKGSYFSEAIKEGTELPPKERGPQLLGVSIFAVMAIAFVLCGVWCLKSALASSFKNQAATNWPTTQGKITQASVRVQEQGTSDFRTMYSPEVVVRFQVNDRWYSCENIYYGYGSTSSCGTVSRDMAGLAPGGTTTVHYNPARPSEAVLQPGFNGTNVVFLAVGSVFLLLGLALSIPLFFGKSKPDPLVVPAKPAW